MFCLLLRRVSMMARLPGVIMGPVQDDLEWMKFCRSFTSRT
jgi:hypothetical protein